MSEGALGYPRCETAYIGCRDTEGYISQCSPPAYAAGPRCRRTTRRLRSRSLVNDDEPAPHSRVTREIRYGTILADSHENSSPARAMVFPATPLPGAGEATWAWVNAADPRRYRRTNALMGRHAQQVRQSSR
jgi:hypothetical protein